MRIDLIEDVMLEVEEVVLVKLDDYREPNWSPLDSLVLFLIVLFISLSSSSALVVARWGVGLHIPLATPPPCPVLDVR